VGLLGGCCGMTFDYTSPSFSLEPGTSVFFPHLTSLLAGADEREYLNFSVSKPCTHRINRKKPPKDRHHTYIMYLVLFIYSSQ
jgi:hypothetical protein